MEIEIIGLNAGFALLAVGLAFMGYFIGKGIQNIGRHDKGHGYHYHVFIKESELEFYFNLNKEEITELLRKYPNAPKIELKGTTYYPYREFMEWISTNDMFKQ